MKKKVLVCSDFETILNNPKRGEGNSFFLEDNIKKIEEKFDVIWNKTGRQLTQEELFEKVKDVDAIITCWNSNQINKEVLDHAPNLKIVAHLAGSVAWLVTEDVFERGVKVIGANDNHFAESVAEGALAYMLVAERRIHEILTLMDNERQNAWGRITETNGILDKTVGIVSFGAIAEHLVKMLQPFRCKIKVYSRSISDEKLAKYNMERASLEEIFSTCDIVSLHTAWNKHTENMINEDLLKRLKKGAVLVNTARGKIIDEPALIRELKTGRFTAVLDVYWQEPLPSDSELYDLKNVLTMPHKGGPTPDRYKYIASDIIDEVYDFLEKGAPLKNEISKERALSMTLQ